MRFVPNDNAIARSGPTATKQLRRELTRMSASTARDEHGAVPARQLIQTELGPRLLDADDDAVVRQVALELDQTVPELTEEFVGWLAEVFPEFNPHDRDTTDLVASVGDNLHVMWHMVAGGLRPEQVEPPPSALLWPRKMVHEDVSLSVLLRVYYLGHAMIWHRWVQPKLRALDPNRTDTRAVSERLHAETFNYLDRAALRVAEHYETEQAKLFTSGARSRAAIAYDILSGTVPTAAMLKVLRFPLQDLHCAWVLWTSSCRLDGQEELLQVADKVHAVLGSAERLSVLHGPSEVWGWSSAPAQITPGKRERLREVLRSRPTAVPEGRRVAGQRAVPTSVDASSGPAPPQLHLAMSTPGRGYGGFRDGNYDARNIKSTVARAGVEAPSVHTSQETGLVALMLTDPAAARRFVNAQLGTLAADNDNTRVRRETVLEFLTNGGSYSRAATALGVHRNTVLYRLQRATKELGRAIELPEHELTAALLISAWLPHEST